MVIKSSPSIFSGLKDSGKDCNMLLSGFLVFMGSGVLTSGPLDWEGFWIG